jgi:hypothetical protein
MLRIPHCLDSRLRDGGKVVSATAALYSPETLLFFCFWYSSLLETDGVWSGVKCGSAGGQMGWRWHRTSRRIHMFIWKGESDPWIACRFLVHKRIISAVKRVEYVSDRMLYITLRGCWCHIIVLNVHAPTEDKTDDLKDSLYGELELVFDKIPKYHMIIL